MSAIRERLNDWTVSGDSSINTAINVNKAGVAGKRHFVTGFEIALRAASGGNDAAVTIKSNANLLWTSYLAQGSARGTLIVREFTRPLVCNVGEAANLDVAAVGANTIVTVSMKGYTLG